MSDDLPVVERPLPCHDVDRVAFILASTRQGPFILNRFDYLVWVKDGSQYSAGIGAYLLERGYYDDDELQLSCRLLDLRRKHHGDGVMVLDVGANIGVFSVGWARHMTGWGQLLAIEPQERIYYALCGNIALNNCWNAQAVKLAISDSHRLIEFSEPHYGKCGLFGAFQLGNNYIPGQELDPARAASVQAITIDALKLTRLDFLKIDIESMECEALWGAAETIRRFRPVISVEVMRDPEFSIAPILREFGYTPPSEWSAETRQLLAVHPDDPIRADIPKLRAAQ